MEDDSSLESKGVIPQLTPVDYASDEIRRLIYTTDGSAVPNHSRLRKINLQSAINYFKGLQEAMYRGFGVAPSVSAKKFSANSAYDMPTDNVDEVKRIVDYARNSMGIYSVATVMGFNWAEVMRECFGDKVKISTFDLNIVQHILSGPEASKQGDVYLADIAVPEISRSLLEETRPDLLFLSNIPDFMNTTESVELAQNIARRGIKAVLVSEDTQGKDVWGDRYTSRHTSFRDTLLHEGYNLQSFQSASQVASINTFHLFVLHV